MGDIKVKKRHVFAPGQEHNPVEEEEEEEQVLARIQ